MKIYKVFALLIAMCGMAYIFVEGKRLPSFAGPYIITVRTGNNITDEFNSTGKIWVHVYFTPPKPKQLQYVWGTVYIGTEINDQQQVDVRISSRSNNQWKKNAIVAKFGKTCTDLKRHAKFLLDIMFEPHERRCPLPAVGLRQLQNQTFNPVFPFFPIVPYARYLFTVGILDPKGNTVGVLVYDADAIPKL